MDTLVRHRLLAGAVVVLAGAILAGVLLLRGDEPPPAPKPAVTEVGIPATAACGPVERPEDLGRHQIPAGEPHPDYSSNPPTSGWYWPGDVAPAFYQVAPAPEQVLRNLSLGKVAIWFGEISDDERSRLMRVTNLLKSPDLVVVNGEDIGVEDPVVLTAWGVLQRCERVSGEAIQRFIDLYAKPFPSGSPSPSPAKP